MSECPPTDVRFREDEDEGAARREGLVRDRLRVRERDRVVDVLDRLAPGDLLDLTEDGGGGEGAVEDVRRAVGLEQRGVLQGSGRYDWGEARKLAELDGCWMRVSALCGCRSRERRTYLQSRRRLHHLRPREAGRCTCPSRRQPTEGCTEGHQAGCTERWRRSRALWGQ